jgi:hypothetical protein
MIRRLFLLASLFTSCAQPAFAQTIAQRARARADSIMAVAKCWRPVRAMPAGTTLSTCADSLEASRVAVSTPLARATPGGVLVMAVQGDTLTMRALLIRGYVFVGPARGSGLGVAHSDVLVTASAVGLWPVTATLNGVSGRAALLVIPRPDLRAAELPRTYLDTRMPAMALSGDTMFVGPPGTAPRCVHNGLAVVCP